MQGQLTHEWMGELLVDVPMLTNVVGGPECSELIGSGRQLADRFGQIPIVGIASGLGS